MHPDVIVAIDGCLRNSVFLFRAAHKPRLTARHCKSRLHWAKEHLNWTEDQWRNIVWSYELRFCVEGISTVKWGSATTYLGYPLTTSAQQFSSYLDSLIVKLEKHAIILSQRWLSILGYSTIANSFLLSRVWHSIRVLSPPQSLFQRIRTVIISFLKEKNFSNVKFQDYQRPRNEDSIAILDPSTQHSALQLQWLTPLLLSSDQATNPDSFATNPMKYTLCALLFARPPVLPLLFPEQRTTDLHKIGCLTPYSKHLIKWILRSIERH
ncbi:hypothetical protein G6F23_010536 [Rhizopus arrhizus]|nr:hypothetical protein G6F23_010536 [Rhizopus arrhizus]